MAKAAPAILAKGAMVPPIPAPTIKEAPRIIRMILKWKGIAMRVGRMVAQASTPKQPRMCIDSPKMSEVKIP